MQGSVGTESRLPAGGLWWFSCRSAGPWHTYTHWLGPQAGVLPTKASLSLLGGRCNLELPESVSGSN